MENMMKNQLTDSDISEMEEQELIRSYRKMQELASRDELTGLLNRRGYENLINDKLALMEEKEVCALFIIDLDNFKSVNDVFGHQAGDDVIKKAAKTLSGLFRANDIVGRLGGDEFVAFICGEFTEEFIRKKAQTICEHLTFVMGSASDIIVTASVGVHVVTEGGHTYEELYKFSDEALYSAKDSGKHCFSIKRIPNGRKKKKEEPQVPVNAVRLKGLLDCIDSGVAMIDMEGDKASFIYVSPAFYKLLDIGEKALYEKNFMELVHPDDRNELERLLREKVMLNRENLSRIARILHADGNIMWWKLHAVRVEYNENKPVVMLTVTDVSELKEKESDLRKNKELYELALTQTIQEIWEVDLEGRSFRIIGENSPLGLDFQDPVSFPEDLIGSGWIFDEAADDFRRFADNIFDGRTQGYANFLIKNAGSDNYGWASFSYRMMLDDVGRPLRAVGIIEGINKEAKHVGEDLSDLNMPEGLMSSLVLRSHINLSRDSVEKLWMEGRDLTGDVRLRTGSQLILEEKNRMYSSEILKNYPHYFSLEGLVAAYEDEGERWLTYEYERIDTAGNIRWVSCVIHMYDEPSTGELHLFSWVLRLDMRRYWENSLGISVYKDPISKLYTRSTFREMSCKLMRNEKNVLCALVIIEIGGISRLYAQDSDSLEMKWKAILTALMLAMGTGCVNGQSGKDRIMLFFPEISSQESLQRRLGDAFHFVRKITADAVDEKLIRFLSVGVCRWTVEADFDIMLKKAQNLCGLWNNAAGDRVVFADEESDSWEQLHETSGVESINAIVKREQRELSQEEKDAAFECLLRILRSGSLSETAASVLGTLGEYYQADRVYILAPVEYGNVITMPHEWTAAHKSSIQQAVSGTLISNFPLLSRCAREDSPTFMTRKNPINVMGLKDPSRDRVWHFAVFPMHSVDGRISYMCIENAHRHERDAALAQLLSECLVMERGKYIRNSRHSGSDRASQGMEIPSLSSYMQNIYNYNSDVYSAMGAVCIDVPDISVINDSQGFEYGRRLLWYIINSMADVFGKTTLFRTWDAEFVALCPNTTRQVFLGKCACLRAMLTRRYPHEIRMGSTWADKVFEAKELVDEARFLMGSEDCTKGRTSDSDVNLPPELAGYSGVGEMIRAGRFTVYMQPKIDIRTNRLFGAEALIRGLDDEGNSISPSRFIDEMEKNGMIRDIDLFLVDRTMRILSEWRNMGYEPVPVSCNFSRQTMFDSNSLASLLAIQSRYPDIDPGLIEIEITEGAGSISQKTLQEEMEKFRKLGVTFSLDDFGSKYSNLAIFTNVKFDTVKLDRSLVSEIVRNEKSRMLVQDIVNICKKSGMCCIAEGVETKEQVETLKEVGCGYVQGFYFDKPLPVDEFRNKHMKKPDRTLKGDVANDKQ